MILPVLLSALLQAVTAPSGGAQFEPLKLGDDDACTADGRWCVGLVEGRQGDETTVRPAVRAGGSDRTDVTRGVSSGQESYQPWRGLMLLADGGFLAGVDVGVSAMYSGGGGQASTVELYRLDAAGDATGGPVLTVPVLSSLLIRACFGEKDMVQRAGACHDEYSFEGKLTAAPNAGSGVMPTLIYATTATAYPRGVSRSKDSLENPPLKPEDLVAARDPTCSFERRFIFDTATGVYQPDRPLPDCSDYTVP
nr:hypothetical protein [uncultured Brevundimonas sp.]